MPLNHSSTPNLQFRSPQPLLHFWASPSAVVGMELTVDDGPRTDDWLRAGLLSFERIPEEAPGMKTALAYRRCCISVSALSFTSVTSSREVSWGNNGVRPQRAAGECQLSAHPPGIHGRHKEGSQPFCFQEPFPYVPWRVPCFSH